MTLSPPKLLGLATDLYELTMAAGYHARGLNPRATSEYFVRRLPRQRSYLVLAGIEQALDYLTTLSFTADEIDYLRSLAVFSHVDQSFFDYLKRFRFTGDVRALPEGTLVFPNEPILSVNAPLIEAQIIETFILSTINFQTLVASKAARMVEAAAGREIIEFGGRRAHGMGAALLAARSAFIGGCSGTSNVEAGRSFDLPLYGTFAHSWVMAFEREVDAFNAYYEVFPENTTLLLDTYDTLAAAKLAAALPGTLGVRLDSGDLPSLARQVRAILDTAGMHHTRIMASGDLDEFKIAAMVEAGAPIDLFGVGTELATSRDAPALGGLYKLVEIESGHGMRPTMKLSDDKATYPSSKKLWRVLASDGRFVRDVVGLASEDLEGEQLLAPVLRNGERIDRPPSMISLQSYAREQVNRLAPEHKRLEAATSYWVHYSDSLEARRREVLAGLA
jgi:nicotinate phosphoribosyltransferase